MLKEICKRKVVKLLSRAEVTINGDKPWDITVRNDGFYHRALAFGSLGLGESYMDGWWESESLDGFFHRILTTELDRSVGSWRALPLAVMARVGNRQSKSRAFEVGRRHYDIGNDLYQVMLDSRMIYSCAYWQNAGDLEQAQGKKLALTCEKLGLAPGMRVLDIGCGWGGMARYMAERHGVEVVGVTVSEEQARLARKRCEGLPVSIELTDYRNIGGCFDRIVSIGMFEHVGYKNYRILMETVRRCLGADGLFLLHTIGGNVSAAATDPWIERYIFPNSMLPSVRQIGAAAEGLFVIEDWHNFGADYDKTLMSWFDNFASAWPGLRDKYGERFYRMWKFYLLSCAGSFRARKNQLWQIVFSPKGLTGGYCSPGRAMTGPGLASGNYINEKMIG